MVSFDVASNICGPYLNAKGLVSYTSLLLDPLEALTADLFAAEVMARLDPTDCAVLAQVGKAWLAAVLSAARGAVPLKLMDFVGSVKLLAWARAKGCPWRAGTCAVVAKGGHLEVLQWAREHHCPWNENMCYGAASGGQLDVLKWAREHDCPSTGRRGWAPGGAEVGAGARPLLGAGTWRF
jgi:hypothetical protein